MSIGGSIRNLVEESLKIGRKSVDNTHFDKIVKELEEIAKKNNINDVAGLLEKIKTDIPRVKDFSNEQIISQIADDTIKFREDGKAIFDVNKADTPSPKIDSGENVTVPKTDSETPSAGKTSVKEASKTADNVADGAKEGGKKGGGIIGKTVKGAVATTAGAGVLGYIFSKEVQDLINELFSKIGELLGFSNKSGANIFGKIDNSPIYVSDVEGVIRGVEISRGTPFLKIEGSNGQPQYKFLNEEEHKKAMQDPNQRVLYYSNTTTPKEEAEIRNYLVSNTTNELVRNEKPKYIQDGMHKEAEKYLKALGFSKVPNTLDNLIDKISYNEGVFVYKEGEKQAIVPFEIMTKDGSLPRQLSEVFYRFGVEQKNLTATDILIYETFANGGKLELNNLIINHDIAKMLDSETSYLVGENEKELIENSNGSGKIYDIKRIIFGEDKTLTKEEETKFNNSLEEVGKRYRENINKEINSLNSKIQRVDFSDEVAERLEGLEHINKELRDDRSLGAHIIFAKIQDGVISRDRYHNEVGYMSLNDIQNSLFKDPKITSIIMSSGSLNEGIYRYYEMYKEELDTKFNSTNFEDFKEKTKHLTSKESLNYDLLKSLQDHRIYGDDLKLTSYLKGKGFSEDEIKTLVEVYNSGISKDDTLMIDKEKLSDLRIGIEKILHKNLSDIKSASEKSASISLGQNSIEEKFKESVDFVKEMKFFNENLKEFKKEIKEETGLDLDELLSPTRNFDPDRDTFMSGVADHMNLDLFNGSILKNDLQKDILGNKNLFNGSEKDKTKDDMSI